MDTPFFSIIIPIYNTPDNYLEPCIKSLMQQSFGSFEIVLVDDGSDKTTAEICDQYSHLDDRIKVIHQKNSGVSVARNNGIMNASSEWIVFVDADDWLEPFALETLYNNAKVVECDMLLFNTTREYANRSVKTKHKFKSNYLYDMHKIENRELLYRLAMAPANTVNSSSYPIYYCWDKAFRRSFLEENNLRFPIGLNKSEDKVFLLSCLQKMDSFYYIDKYLHHYRINSNSMCNKYCETADNDRRLLSSLLLEYATQMNAELSKLKNDSQYNQIIKDYYRFIFGIISDVLFLKYYHPDFDLNKRERAKEVKAFLKSEPFSTSINECEYSELDLMAKLKKLLLQLGLVSVFCFIKTKHSGLFKKAMKDQE